MAKNRGYILLVMLSAAIVLLTLPQAALCTSPRLVTQVALPEGWRPSRYFTISYDLASTEAGPVPVFALARDIYYFDAATLEVTLKRTYASNESANISANGKYVAVVSRLENKETDQIVKRVRIETWKGETLWEMGASMKSRFEPTPTGGFIEYPSLRSGIFTDPDPAERKQVPRPWPHGLRVYDDTGNLVLEGISNEEMFLGCDRHFFAGTGPAEIAISSMGDRILCFAHESDRGAYRPDHDLFLFDREGNLLLRRDMFDSGSFCPERAVLSPDGELCGVTSKHQRAYSIRLEDGSTVWEYDAPQDLSAITCRSIANNGMMLLAASRKARETNSWEYDLLFVDQTGRLAYRFDDESIKTGGVISAALLSRDGTSAWVMQGGRLSLYSLSTLPRRPGSDE